MSSNLIAILICSSFGSTNYLGTQRILPMLRGFFTRNLRLGGPAKGVPITLKVTVLRRRSLALIPSILWLLPIPIALGWAVPELEYSIPRIAMFSGAFAVAYLVTAAFTRFSLFRIGLADFTIGLASSAAQEIARHVALEAAVPFLHRAAASGDRGVRCAAAWGYASLPIPHGDEGLRKLLKDPDPRVVEEAMKAGRLSLETRRSHPQLSLAGLPALLSAYQSAKQDASGNLFLIERNALSLRKATEAIDGLVNAQHALRQAMPAVYCAACLRRPEEQSFEHWQWLRCPACQDAKDLEPGVHTVIGAIGWSQGQHIADGELRIEIWDPRTRTVKDAEIDGLEIVGGSEMDYDWAITAVLGALESSGRNPKIWIKLVHAPNISTNTLRMLQALDPALREV